MSDSKGGRLAFYIGLEDPIYMDKCVGRCLFDNSWMDDLGCITSNLFIGSLLPHRSDSLATDPPEDWAEGEMAFIKGMKRTRDSGGDE